MSKLETGCKSRSDQQFIRPMIEAQVQSELYEVLLGWLEASPKKANGPRATPENTASVVSWAIFGAGLEP